MQNDSFHVICDLLVGPEEIVLKDNGRLVATGKLAEEFKQYNVKGVHQARVEEGLHTFKLHASKKRLRKFCNEVLRDELPITRVKHVVN